MHLRTIPCCVALLAVACPSSPPGPAVNDVPPACSRPVAASALPGAQLLLHEAHTTGDNVSFTVPAGTGSLTILHQATKANLLVVYLNSIQDNSAVPGVIYQPDGTKAYDDNDPAYDPSKLSSPDGGTDPSGLYAMYGGGTPTTAAFTIPNTARSLDAGVPAGQWSFRVSDYAFECAQANSNCSDGGATGNTYDVTVLATPAPPATPTLDVAFYLVASVPFTAADAINDPSVKRMVSTFRSIYAKAGITVGTVTFYDVPAAAVTRFGTHINADSTGPCDELDQMFLLSADHPGNMLNLFLVQSITSQSNAGGSVVGIDGTIPGPAGFAGTVHSGAAVSLADLYQGTGSCAGGINLNCGADEVAYIAAHEAGHFLGLFHTTEAEGLDFDPITDTAKCPCTQCAPSSQRASCTSSSASNIFLTANFCVSPGAGCGGGDNLMFWQLEAGVSLANLSAQQGAVMRFNPAVH